MMVLPLFSIAMQDAAVNVGRGGAWRARRANASLTAESYSKLLNRRGPSAPIAVHLFCISARNCWVLPCADGASAGACFPSRCAAAAGGQRGDDGEFAAG